MCLVTKPSLAGVAGGIRSDAGYGTVRAAGGRVHPRAGSPLDDGYLPDEEAERLAPAYSPVQGEPEFKRGSRHTSYALAAALPEAAGKSPVHATRPLRGLGVGVDPEVGARVGLEEPAGEIPEFRRGERPPAAQVETAGTGQFDRLANPGEYGKSGCDPSNLEPPQSVSRLHRTPLPTC